MIICTVHFDKDKEDFSDLLKVWEYSAKKHHPDATIKILTVPAPEERRRECAPYLSYSSSYAFWKMAEWAIEQDDDVLMTDADVFFLGDCSSAFDELFNHEPFEVGVTVRHAKSWLNGGVVFMKRGGQELLQQIVRLTMDIVCNPIDYIEHVSKYLGGDQTALTIFTEKGLLKRFPCHIWNLEQSSWQWFSEKTKIVHMKSSLWDLVHGDTPRIGNTEDNHIYEIFDIWKDYLRRAK